MNPVCGHAHGLLVLDMHSMVELMNTNQHSPMPTLKGGAIIEHAMDRGQTGLGQ